RALGYSPNASATAMKTDSSQTVGVFISEMHNPFYQDLFIHLVAYLAQQNLRVMVWHTQKNALDAINAINEKAVDALIISALSRGSKSMMAALKSERPVVLLNRVLENFESDYVIGDNYG